MGEAIPMLGAAGADEGHQAEIDSLSIQDVAIGKTTVIVAGFLPEGSPNRRFIEWPPTGFTAFASRADP